MELKGSCASNESRGSTAVLDVCTCNVTLELSKQKTTWTDRLTKMARLSGTSLACVTYKTGEGLSKIRGGYRMYEIGKIQDNGTSMQKAS